jgi:hypothetical protein
VGEEIGEAVHLPAFAAEFVECRGGVCNPAGNASPST